MSEPRRGNKLFHDLKAHLQDMILSDKEHVAAERSAKARRKRTVERRNRRAARR